jgi:DNA-binding beta-propeller fold protein YncE
MALNATNPNTLTGVSPKLIIGIVFLILVVAIVFILKLNKNKQETATSDAAKHLITTNVYYANFINNGLTFYNSTEKRFKRLENDDTAINLASTSLPDAVAYSKNKQVAAIHIADANSVHWQIINLENGAIVANLDSSIITLSFSPDGQRIIYEYNNGSSHNISVANRDGSDWKKIIDLNAEFARGAISDMYWLKPETYSLYYLNNTSTYNLLGLSSKTAQSIVTGASGSKESPSGNYIFVDSRNSSNTTSPIDTSLLTVGSDGISSVKPLKIGSPSEWCAWASENDSLYCVNNIDNDNALLKIDLTTNKQTTILNSNIVNNQLFENQNGDLFQLLGVKDNKIYYLINNSLYSFAY